MSERYFTRKEAIAAGENLSPITREEAFKQGTSLSPLTRKEKLLNGVGRISNTFVPIRIFVSYTYADGVEDRPAFYMCGYDEETHLPELATHEPGNFETCLPIIECNDRRYLFLYWFMSYDGEYDYTVSVSKYIRDPGEYSVIDKVGAVELDQIDVTEVDFNEFGHDRIRLTVKIRVGFDNVEEEEA